MAVPSCTGGVGGAGVQAGSNGDPVPGGSSQPRESAAAEQPAEAEESVDEEEMSLHREGEEEDENFSNTSQLSDISASQTAWKVEHKQMSCMRLPCGIEISSPAELRRVAVDFYSDLYKTENCDLGKMERLHQGLPSLSEEEWCGLDTLLTLQEFTAAVMHLSNQNAPGIDGLQAEFYKYFWDCTGQDIYKVRQECSRDGDLPLSCRRAGITLLPKKGDLCNLKNWRPRGIRQGCSLSGMLYSLSIEPFLHRLREKLTELAVPPYADDVNVFIINDRGVAVLESCIENYEKATSAQVNWAKSAAFLSAVLYLPREEGGQGLIDIFSRVAVFRLQAAQKLLYAPEWLSVGKCLDRLLEQWPALLKFFTSKESPSSSVTKGSSGAHAGGPDKKAQPHSDRPHERAQSSSAQQPTVTAQLKQSQVHKKPGPKQMPSISGKLVHTSIPTKQKFCSKESSAKAQEGHCQKLKRPSSDSQKKSLSTSGKTKPRESMPLSTKQDIIKSCFERASTKLYCLFLQASIPAFDKLNLLLQSDKPNIHVLGRELQAIYTDLLCKFKPAVLVAASSVYTVDFRSLNNQKSENDLVIGTKTRQYLHACIADKSLQHEDVKLFYSSAKAYFSEACTYMQKKFPLQDELLRNAQVADISQREKVSFDCALNFVDRFGLVKEDELESQFFRGQFVSRQG
ncbi:uncharacterized protein LOC117964702 [Acipenser ruthenus]|uniref:uncharacterized protein LOC117964702 n=1 Tax=Acipenser ruthenus TaxID=7906 RepID=UPI00274147F7|nr:uncharacterized protein LOC117964702 [Acipenser ruthenus]